jgi:hypothetical protein
MDSKARKQSHCDRKTWTRNAKTNPFDEDELKAKTSLNSLVSGGYRDAPYTLRPEKSRLLETARTRPFI